MQNACRIAWLCNDEHLTEPLVPAIAHDRKGFLHFFGGKAFVTNLPSTTAQVVIFFVAWKITLTR